MACELYRSVVNSKGFICSVTAARDRMWRIQGSILRPKFFVVYINSLPPFVNGLETSLYTDDNALLATGDNEVDMTQTLL